MNLVCIDGRLTKDNEIKMTTNNKKIISFSIANQRDKEHSDFINCVAFENNAEFLNKYFKKGDGVNITGELRQNVLVSQLGFPIQKKKENETSTTKIDDSGISDTNFDNWSAGKDIKIDPDELPFY